MASMMAARAKAGGRNRQSAPAPVLQRTQTLKQSIQGTAGVNGSNVRRYAARYAHPGLVAKLIARPVVPLGQRGLCVLLGLVSTVLRDYLLLGAINELFCAVLFRFAQNAIPGLHPASSMRSDSSYEVRGLCALCPRPDALFTWLVPSLRSAMLCRAGASAPEVGESAHHRQNASTSHFGAVDGERAPSQEGQEKKAQTRWGACPENGLSGMPPRPVVRVYGLAPRLCSRAAPSPRVL